MCVSSMCVLVFICPFVIGVEGMSVLRYFSDQPDKSGQRSQVAERLGNRASNLKVTSSIPGCAIMSLGKALHPTCLRGNVPVL